MALVAIPDSEGTTRVGSDVATVEGIVSESAFAPYVGFGVLMTSRLGTNVILMRYVVAISPMKDSKS